MLNRLRDNKEIKIFIATNKRKDPTKKILDFLNWNMFFDDHYCIDSFPQNNPNKSNLLSFIMKKYCIRNNNCLYIGDRYADYIAAETSNIKFIGVTWGHKELNKEKYNHINSIDTPSADKILRLL